MEADPSKIEQILADNLPLFVRYIRATEFLPYMDFLREYEEEIQTVEGNKGKTEANKLFLEKLKSSSTPGKWRTFLNTLQALTLFTAEKKTSLPGFCHRQQIEYEYLHKLLVGEPVSEDREHYIRLIKVLVPVLLEKIAPLQMTDQLKARDCLTQQDVENIQSVTHTKGNMEGSVLLLDRVTRRKDDWFYDFMITLYDNDLVDMVMEIDPDFTQKRILTPLDLGVASNRIGSVNCTQQDTGGCWASGTSIDSNALCSQTCQSTKCNSSAPEDDSILSDASTEPYDCPNSASNEAEWQQTLGANSIPQPFKASNINDEEVSTPPDMVPERLELRPYQLELISPALQGSNTIIMAPSSSGKRFAALGLIERHLENSPFGAVRKVVFVVRTRLAADEIGSRCKKYLSKYEIIIVRGAQPNSANIPLRELHAEYDIFVVTFGKLKNALRCGRVQLSDCSLLILDQCHLTIDDRVYNTIMGYYQDQKVPPVFDDDQRYTVPPLPLPQVVGITASVTSTKQTEEEVREFIMRLCANMDINIISTVRNIDDVESTMVFFKEGMVMVPSSHIAYTPVERRQSDPMARIIESLMTGVEAKMKDKQVSSVDCQVCGLTQLSVPPLDRLSNAYCSWLDGNHGLIQGIFHRRTRRCFLSCNRILQTYQNGLLLNAECRGSDALKHITAQLSRIFPTVLEEADCSFLESGLDCNETQMIEAFNAQMCQLAVHSGKTNPKLAQLKCIIRNCFHVEPDTRLVIFLKKWVLLDFFWTWMMETDGLRELEPVIMADKLGPKITDETQLEKKQCEILQKFKGGKHKVIVTVSSPSQDLCVPECNAVIRTDFPVDAIAKWQSTAASRNLPSKYRIKPATTAYSVELNVIRESMREKVIQEVIHQQTDDAENYREEIKGLQTADLLSRRQTLQLREDEPPDLPERIELRCRACGAFVCDRDHIRLRSGYLWLVIDPHFSDRYRVVEHPEPKILNRGKGHKRLARILCNESGCDEKWGIIVSVEGRVFPALTIQGLTALRNGVPEPYVQKWRFARFKVAPFASWDLDSSLPMSQFLEDISGSLDHSEELPMARQ